MRGFSYLQRKSLGGEDNYNETADTLFSKLFHNHVLFGYNFSFFCKEWDSKKHTVLHNVKNIKFYDDVLSDDEKSAKLMRIYYFLSKKLSNTSCKECAFSALGDYVRIDAMIIKDSFSVVYEIKLSKYKLNYDYKEKFLAQCCFTKRVLFSNNIDARKFILFYVNLSTIELEKYVFSLKNDCNYNDLIKNVKSRYVLRDDNNFTVEYIN